MDWATTIYCSNSSHATTCRVATFAILCIALFKSVWPIETQVLKMKFIPETDELQPLGEVIIQMEAHSACDCECRVKATDCNNRTQHYDADSCSCRCINESLADTCQLPKHWSQQQCACVCQTILNCLDDEYFNYGTCT